MTRIYRVATPNINGITFATWLRMLEEFLHKHDIDIALLQEITYSDLSNLRNYNAHINQGTEGRGTAILTKADLTVTNTKRLP
jgi:exonuclease III